MTFITKRQELPVFGDMMTNLFDGHFFEPIRKQSTQTKKTPSVNIFEDEANFTIQLATPGMSKDAFKIDLNDSKIEISAKEEKKEEVEKEENKAVKNRYTVREFDFKTFKRVFTLPKNADNTKIDAKYHDGILEVKIAKKESEKVKHIEIS